MAQKAPGKAYREGLSLIEVMDMIPTEDAAREWIESVIWPAGRCCGKCGSTNTRPASHKTMPYWCTDCRGYFSVKTATPLASSNIPLRKWAIAIYLCLTSLKSVSSMKLHRDLKISSEVRVVHAASHPRGVDAEERATGRTTGRWRWTKPTWAESGRT